MNRNDIFRMGREAGFDEWENTDNVYFLEVIVRFAVLVAAAERETCAQELEAIAGQIPVEQREGYVYKTVIESAAAIRARGKKE